MKVFFLSTLIAGSLAFTVNTPYRSPVIAHAPTALHAAIPVEDMDADQLKIMKLIEKWKEVRHLSQEEADATLDEEWLEAYNRYYKKYDEDWALMKEIAANLQPILDPPKIKKKTKGQKRRDKYARKIMAGAIPAPPGWTPPEHLISKPVEAE